MRIGGFMKLLSMSVLVLIVISTPLLADDGYISTTGTGSASIFPDEATLYFTIITRNSKSNRASEKNSKLYEQIVTGLNEIGFKKEEIITAFYHVNSDYERPKGKDEGRKIGYVAEHRIKLKTNDFSLLGNIYDVVLEPGECEINRITYNSSKIDSVREEALVQAIEKAKGEAQAMAVAAGGILGDLVELATPDAQRMFGINHIFMRGGGTRVSNSIVPDEITVNLTVVGRWKFKPNE